MKTATKDTKPVPVNEAQVWKGVKKALKRRRKQAKRGLKAQLKKRNR